MPEMKRTAKDSVFTYLFKQPMYTRQLYLALHPEDTAVTEADCKVISLENVLTTGLYNDLGIQVRGRLILLVEAQSTFSVNIVLRLLLYLAETYMQYIKEHKLDLYASPPVFVPTPELYVIYTGSREKVPDTLYLSDLYQGAGGVEVQVHVLRGSAQGNIVDQYVQFCKILDEQRVLYGRTKRAIEETLRICKERNVLTPFLASRQKEVVDIMSMLFDQKEIMEIHDYNIAQAARRDGWQRGRQEGWQKGRQEGWQKGMQEGRQEGWQKGSELEFLRMAKISKVLTEKGRGGELSKALMDRGFYERLLKEFGL